MAREPAGKEGLLAYVSKDPTSQPELSTRRLTRKLGTPVPRLAWRGNLISARPGVAARLPGLLRFSRRV